MLAGGSVEAHAHHRFRHALSKIGVSQIAGITDRCLIDHAAHPLVADNSKLKLHVARETAMLGARLLVTLVREWEELLAHARLDILSLRILCLVAGANRRRHVGEAGLGFGLLTNGL